MSTAFRQMYQNAYFLNRYFLQDIESENLKLSKEQRRVIQRSHISDILDGTEVNDINFSARAPDVRRRRKHHFGDFFGEEEA